MHALTSCTFVFTPLLGDDIGMVSPKFILCNYAIYIHSQSFVYIILEKPDNRGYCHQSFEPVLMLYTMFFCFVLQDDAAKIPFRQGKFTREGINEGKVEGMSSIVDVEDEEGRTVTEITISEDITFNTFSIVLEFLYTGKKEVAWRVSVRVKLRVCHP